MTCGEQPCVGMAISSSLREHHRLRKRMGGSLTLADRLDLSSERGMPPTGSCVIAYVSTRGPYGFGQIQHKGKPLAAHRVAYELAKGSIGKGKYILHIEECTDPRCIHDDCLWEGTPSDMIYLQVSRGTHGRKNHHITPGVAECIRQLVYVGQFENNAIGQKYDIDESQVSRIAHRLIYSDRPLNEEEREALKRRAAQAANNRQRNRRLHTDDEVREIRRRLESGESGASIARDLDCSNAHISEIKKGKRRFADIE